MRHALPLQLIEQFLKSQLQEEVETSRAHAEIWVLIQAQLPVWPKASGKLFNISEPLFLIRTIVLKIGLSRYFLFFYIF